MKFYTNVGIKNNKITHSYYEDGKKYIQVTNYEPSLGIAVNSNTKYKTLKNKPAKIKTFKDIKEFKDFKYENEEMLDLHGNISPIYQFISDNYSGVAEFDTEQVRVCYIDIEVMSNEGFPYPEDANYPIVSISFRDSKTSNYIVLALNDYDKDLSECIEDPTKIKFKKFQNEKQLLSCFFKLFQKMQFDIITGWNTNGFDLPYIINRGVKILNKSYVNKLSPFGTVKLDQWEEMGRTKFKNKIQGVACLDYLEVYKKYIYGQKESYSLDAISKLELETNKIDYSEYHDLNELYNKNHQKFIDYNIYDCELVYLFDKKLGLLNLMMTIAYMAKINYEDVFSPVKTWDVFIYNILRDKNILIPPMAKNEHKSYPGAWVKEPDVGLYDWVTSFDLNSLYPHIIMGMNISPETIIDNKREFVKENELDQRYLDKAIEVDSEHIHAANGHYFRKDVKGFMPVVLEELYSNRSKTKKEMLGLKKELEKM